MQNIRSPSVPFEHNTRLVSTLVSIKKKGGWKGCWMLVFEGMWKESEHGWRVRWRVEKKNNIGKRAITRG